MSLTSQRFSVYQLGRQQYMLSTMSANAHRFDDRFTTRKKKLKFVLIQAALDLFLLRPWDFTRKDNTHKSVLSMRN